MPERFGAESTDFKVVLHQRSRRAERVQPWRKEFPLKIKARSPCQYTADVQSFTFNLPEHIGRCYTFGRTCVVSATCAMYMMITAPISRAGRVDPSFHLE